MNHFKRILRVDDFTSVWRISVNGETVDLAENLVGLEHLQACLRFPGRPYPYRGTGQFVGEIQDYGYDPADPSGAENDCENPIGNSNGSLPFNYGKRQQVREYGLGTRRGQRGIGPAIIKASISELSREAKEALASGNKRRYDTLQVDIVRWRQYERSTSGIGGKSRTFPTPEDREFDQIRKSIDRALEAIRKKNSYIGSYLKQTVRREGYAFAYTGELEWDLAAERIGPVESEPLTPDEIRENWRVEREIMPEPSPDWVYDKYDHGTIHAVEPELPPAPQPEPNHGCDVWWQRLRGGLGRNRWPLCPVCHRPAVAFGHCNEHRSHWKG